LSIFEKLFGKIDPDPQARLLDTIKTEMEAQVKKVKDDSSITTDWLFGKVMRKKYFALNCARYDITHTEVREMAEEVVEEHINQK